MTRFAPTFRAARVGALAVPLLAAGCAILSPSPQPPPPHAAAHAARPDWFQQQLAQARLARRTHLPKTDTAGAQAAYDGVVRAACTRVALSGPDKYKARCDAVLRPAATPAAPEPDLFPCAEDATDPDALAACND